MLTVLRELRTAADWLQMPWWRLAAATTAGVAGVGSAVALVGVAAWIIATAAGMPGVAALGLSVVGVRGLGISRGALRYVERLLGHDVALRGLTQLRGTLYARCAAADTATVASWSRGRVVHQMVRDADVLCSSVIRGVLPLAVVGCVAVATAVAMWWIVGVPAGWFAAGVSLALVGATWATAAGTAAALRRERDAAADTADVVDAVLTHRAEWEVAGRFDEAARRLAAAHHEVAAASRPHAWAAGGAAAAIWVGLAVAVAGVLATAPTSPQVLTNPVWYCVAGLLPLATFDALAALPPAVRELVVGRDAARRLAPIMAIPAVAPEESDHRSAAEPAVPAPTAPSHSSTGAASGPHVTVPEDAQESDDGAETAVAELRTGGLVVGWGGRAACQVPDLTLRPGDCVALTGPSGSGKTAALLTVAGLLPPVAGAVTVRFGAGVGHDAPGGVAPTDLPTQQARQVVAVGTEDAHIFGTSVRENLTLTGGPASDDWLTEVMTRVGLGSWLAATPVGLDTVLTADHQALSGGERRRVVVARTLAARTPVVLLDEPTEHLDAAAATQLADTLRDWATQRSAVVVVATHATPVFADSGWPMRAVFSPTAAAPRTGP